MSPEQVQLSYEAFCEALGTQRPYLLNPAWHVLVFHPPLTLLAVYLLLRKFFTARKPSVVVVLCLFLGLVLYVGFISITWGASISYYEYQDALLQRAISRYETPPQVLVDFYHADRRGAGPELFGVIYGVISLIRWTPVLLLYLAIDVLVRRIRTGRWGFIGPMPTPAV